MNNTNTNNMRKGKKSKKCKLKIGQKVRSHVLDKDRDLKRVLIVENVQKGINSSFYSSGRFSVEKEKGVHHFHRF